MLMLTVVCSCATLLPSDPVRHYVSSSVVVGRKLRAW